LIDFDSLMTDKLSSNCFSMVRLMTVCYKGDGYLPIVKSLLNLPKMQVNEQEEVITVESISWFVFVFN
jgi:hypothetical protein